MDSDVSSSVLESFTSPCVCEHAQHARAALEPIRFICARLCAPTMYVWPFSACWTYANDFLFISSRICVVCNAICACAHVRRAYTAFGRNLVTPPCFNRSLSLFCIIHDASRPWMPYPKHFTLTFAPLPNSLTRASVSWQPGPYYRREQISRLCVK